ncbi:hypothetical protein BJX99DRAFT_174402 [Aspergillus californicus]
MATYETYETHDNNYGKLSDAIEKIRKKYPDVVRRPGRVGDVDSHGHMWYCFYCQRGVMMRQHRSYDSHRAMWDHLRLSHSEFLYCLETVGEIHW